MSTEHHDQTPEPETRFPVRPVLDGIIKTVRETPHRMPAGGWIREIATSENWRTTTIVRRHRDQAAMTPPS